MQVRIENWSVVEGLDDPYTPPEMRQRSLNGLVHGHPHFPDGHSVTTSRLVELDRESGRAKTRSGTEYVLGDPHPDYRQWCEDQGVW